MPLTQPKELWICTFSIFQDDKIQAVFKVFDENDDGSLVKTRVFTSTWNHSVIFATKNPSDFHPKDS